ncbi:hypothetical protein [Aliikangiella sp. IMCC44359]|uniref:hypothetical protein n=1 Tax=Aliikangiella sp. IMCC44359 TaxID=3459125 RepID=UPI00403A9833
MSSELQKGSDYLVELHFNRSGGFIDVILDGGITLAVLNDTFERLLKHARFEFDMNACYDFTRAYPDLGMSDIGKHASFVSKNQYRRGTHYKLALVSNDTLGTALLSIYKSLISHTPIDVEVFVKKTQAIQWLIEDS